MHGRGRLEGVVILERVSDGEQRHCIRHCKLAKRSFLSLDLGADITKRSSPLELRPDTRHASVKHGFETMAKLLVIGRHEATVPSSAVLFSS